MAWFEGIDYSICPYCKQRILNIYFADHHATCPERRKFLERLKAGTLEKWIKPEEALVETPLNPADKVLHYINIATDNLEKILTERDTATFLTDEEAKKLGEAMKKLSEIWQSIEERQR